MNRTEYLSELQGMKADLEKWTYDSGLQRHICHVGDLTITVDRGHNGAHWKVEHERFTMPDDCKGFDVVVAYAKRAALDRAKQWVELNVEPAVHA